MQENEGPERKLRKLLMGEVSHGMHPVPESSSAAPPRGRPSSAQQILAGWRPLGSSAGLVKGNSGVFIACECGCHLLPGLQEPTAAPCCVEPALPFALRKSLHVPETPFLRREEDEVGCVRGPGDSYVCLPVTTP